MIETMKQALEVLDDYVDDPRCQKEIDAAITSLRKAIAEGEKQEALQKLHDENERLNLYQGVYEQEPVRLQCTTCGTVYANGVPPQRQWSGLTYEEQEEIVFSAHSLRDAINRTDWKLKEKNT